MVLDAYDDNYQDDAYDDSRVDDFRENSLSLLSLHSPMYVR